MLTYEAPMILQDESGKRFLNPEKLGEAFFPMRADDYPLAVPASGVAQTAFTVPQDAGHAGDFEVSGIVGRGVAPFTMRFALAGIEANAFMNNPVHHGLLLGQRGLPSVFAETFLAPAGQTIQVEVNNLSTTLANSVKLAILGRKFTAAMSQEERERRAQFLRERPTRPYWLTLDLTKASISADAADQEYFLSAPSGSHFAAQDILAESTGRFQVRIFDGNSGREITYGYVDSDLITGKGGLPARMLGASMLTPRKSLRVLFKDVSGVANVIYFSMHGQRLLLPVG